MIEWFTAAELAALKLPSVAATKSGVIRAAKRLGWDDRQNMAGAPLARRREGRGGGIEYHYTLLPSRAQALLVRRNRKTEVVQEPKQKGRAELWDWYDRQPETKKQRTKEKLQALQDIKRLRRGGLTKNEAVCEVGRQIRKSPRTIYGWMDLVAGADEADWLPLLCPRHAGRQRDAECDPNAWAFLKGDYLRLSKPPFETCYERLKMMADAKGWSIPSARTLMRRLESDLPKPVTVYLREGSDALKRMYPPQERDRSDFHALQAVNVDGHKWDVFVKWPADRPGGDPIIDRPMMVALQDLYSNKILAWRLDFSENTDVVRLAFKDMFEEYGIPDQCYLDNGRAFASKYMTGQSPTRYRFKVKAEEPVGLLTALGIDLHWTTPYSGQSKPIERAFGDLCNTIAKHPAFEGAYTGNKPDAKPENYAQRAVPIEEFIKVVDQGIRLYNTRQKRGTRVCARQMSFDEAFNRSYESSVIRKASPEQLRMCLLAAESVKADAKTGAIRLLGNRYWSEVLHHHVGRHLTVRFDPDDLHGTVHLYRMDGVYVGDADCIEAVGFADAEAARKHSAKRRRHARAVKEMAAIERELDAPEIARQLAEIEVEEGPTPDAKVVRMVSGNTALAARPQVDAEEETDNRERHHRALKNALNMHVLQGGLQD